MRRRTAPNLGTRALRLSTPCGIKICILYKIASQAISRFWLQILNAQGESFMPRKARPHPKPARRPTFIRAWRKHRELTLAQLADRLSVELEVEISEGQLSRIERGETPYSQDILEALAHVLRCEPADLIIRDPSQSDAIWSLIDSLKPIERLQAIEVIKALQRTGTGG
jgi:transcriptional regulator with XRE-family HTH domain